VSRRSARLLAWSQFALFVAIAVATVALAGAERGGDEYLAVFAIGYPLVGAVVASRQPRNAVGWILLVIGIFLGLGALADTNLRSASAPALGLSGWISDAGWYFWLTPAAVFLPLVFPNGRLVSRRWRPALWLGVAALAASVIGAGFAPGPFDVDSPRPVHNPVGIEGAGGLLDALSQIGDVLATLAFLLAAASLVVRFRRSRGTERQQLKWFAFVGLIAVAGLALAMLQVLFGLEPGDEVEGGWLEVVGAVGWSIALLAILIGIPVATGLAILRHRLYDIDVVIRRTLVYGALTATLAGSYVCSVLLLQLVLSPGSDFSIAASTLAVAALFRPAASRIQRLVDRRFFRRKYDAALTIEGFGARLRDEVELDALSAELRAVVADTMQPAHVSLWLREAAP
jgi:hypothetical protein